MVVSLYFVIFCALSKSFCMSSGSRDNWKIKESKRHKHLLNDKGKASPVQTYIGPEYCRSMRLPGFSVTRHKNGGKLTLWTCRLHPARYSFYLAQTAMAIARSEGLRQRRISMTPSGIEPSAFRVIAQCLKQLPYLILTEYLVHF